MIALVHDDDHLASLFLESAKKGAQLCIISGILKVFLDHNDLCLMPPEPLTTVKMISASLLEISATIRSRSE
jgi:hypothetical protein